MTTRSTTMIERALSVQQPWAWAITSGFKTIENRSWATSYRGRVAIHASSNERWLTAAAYYDLDDALFSVDPRIGEILDTDPNYLDRGFVHLSCIVGTVEIIDCVDYYECSSYNDYPPSPFGIDHEEWASGDYCWMLAHAHRFRVPIPTSGKLNLWKLSPELRSAVERAETDILTDPKEPARNP